MTEQHKCPHCSYSSKHRHHLLRHLRKKKSCKTLAPCTHKYPCKCPNRKHCKWQCGYTSDRTHNLIRHENECSCDKYESPPEKKPPQWYLERLQQWIDLPKVRITYRGYFPYLFGIRGTVLIGFLIDGSFPEYGYINEAGEYVIDKGIAFRIYGEYKKDEVELVAGGDPNNLRSHDNIRMYEKYLA